MHKPYGYLSQFVVNGKQKKRNKLLGELYDFPAGTMAIGRLDRNSEGLLLLTTDGKVSYDILSHKYEKEYYVKVDGSITEEAIQQLKEEGNTIIGIEITDKSIDIQNFNFKNHEKIVLLLGSERHGIKNIDHIDYSISIPMYGRNSSMNVIHSLSIALYEVTNQLK